MYSLPCAASGDTPWDAVVKRAVNDHRAAGQDLFSKKEEFEAYDERRKNMQAHAAQLAVLEEQAASFEEKSVEARKNATELTAAAVNSVSPLLASVKELAKKGRAFPYSKGMQKN